MMRKHLSLAAALAAAALATAANAEFFDGAPILIGGTAFGGAGGYTAWGSFAQGNQGPHYLGTTTGFYETQSGLNNPIVVSSTVNDPYSATISIDFTALFSQEFWFADFTIQGLKNDGSIIGFQGNLAGLTTDGNTVSWQGSAAVLAELGVVSFKVFQSPAPGALALLGIAGAAGARRRRA